MERKLRPITDSEFDKVYPKRIIDLSSVHWTPIEIAKIALEWLQVNKKSHVLDIGSGVGKFCIIGATSSEGKFSGVEKRPDLVRIGKKICADKKLENVSFINSDITQIEFNKYNAFYYYNPFCEQIALDDFIDDTITFSHDKYRMYEDYVFSQLEKQPIGTRIVTYCSQRFALPSSYSLKNVSFNGSLALWVKIED